MASDKLVESADVLKGILKIRRLGNLRVMQNLEAREPDLVEFLLEELTGIHHKLGRLGVHPKIQRQIGRKVESLMLVAVSAMEWSHARLWAGMIEGPLKDPSTGLLVAPEGGSDVEGEADGN